MKVYNVTPIYFMGRRTVAAPTASNVTEDFTKDSFYTQIEGFLKNQYTKEKYLKMFSDGVDKIVKQQKMAQYTPIERQYINNLVAVMDVSESLKVIPEQYLKKNMQELLMHRV